MGVDEADILEMLFELARDAGFEIRAAGRLAPDDPPLLSGVCRLRGKLYIVLSANESVPVQIEALALAIRENASETLQNRHLPPAIRDLLDPAGSKPFGSS
ncbi:MAG: hypothetical protein CBC32_010285 [Proteobacteria bacterium TMED72]|nr:MAG: hypothetical protein CBC32_010285 [Proteobacteria bacterium TMED72]